MYTNNIKLTCQIREIGKIRKFTRQNKSTFVKRTITLQTDDGQLLFCEIRKMNLLSDFTVGDVAIFDISFAGSEKNGKKYNNIFINKITRP